MFDLISLHHQRPRLIICISHINQQIALKIIKKLHFSVNAVWNGQEALDYLKGGFGPTHPQPDIILMDVQVSTQSCYETISARETNLKCSDAYSRYVTTFFLQVYMSSRRLHDSFFHIFLQIYSSSRRLHDSFFHIFLQIYSSSGRLHDSFHHLLCEFIAHPGDYITVPGTFFAKFVAYPGDYITISATYRTFSTTTVVFRIP